MSTESRLDMYKLTDRMLQHLEKNLIEFHKLFQGGRCQAQQLEELVAKAINSDFRVKDKAFWKGNGHDIDADISIGDFKISVKSGKIKKNRKKEERLIISGHRLGRLEGDLDKISNFLSSNNYLLIAVPYYENENHNGKQHIYQIFYLDTKTLKLEDHTKWGEKKGKKGGKSYYAINDFGVEMGIYPSLSWQIWWEIPISMLKEDNKTRLIIINQGK